MKKTTKLIIRKKPPAIVEIDDEEDTGAEVEATEERSEEADDAVIEMMSRLNKKYGEGTVMRASEAVGLNVQRFSTGCFRLDFALGGGLPQCRMIEIFGNESAGKTTIVLSSIAQFQKKYKNGIAVLIDFERTFDPNYAKNLGVNIDYLLVISPDHAEQGADALNDILQSNKLHVYVAVDSLAAMTPTSTMEISAEKAEVGVQARLINRMMAKCNMRMKRNLSDPDYPTTTVVFVNQERQKVGVMFGDPTCFYYDSKVLLSDGTTESIGRIVNSNKEFTVMSHDPATGKLVPRKVTHKHNKGAAKPDEFILVKAGRAGGNGRTQLIVTRNHWVFTPKGEMQAGSLVPGTDFLLVKGHRRLNSLQTDLAVASGLLGDATLGVSHGSQTSGNVRLRLAQSSSQIDYLKWKQRVMGSLALALADMQDKATHVFETAPFSDLTDLRRKVIRNGKRCVTPSLLSHINLRVFAIWFMDDGTFNYEENGYPRASLACAKYRDAEREVLADRLAELGLPRPSVQPCGRLTWNGDKAVEALTLVEAHFPKPMRYKLPLSVLGKEYVFPVEPEVNEPMLVPVPVLSISAPKRKLPHPNKYDLTIEGTHSYFVDGALVHNTTPGGLGKNFFCSARIRLFSSGATKKKVNASVTVGGIKKDVLLARITSFEIIKNKSGGMPFEDGEYTYFLKPHKGYRPWSFDNEGALFDMGRFHGLIKFGRAGFEYGDLSSKKEHLFIDQLRSDKAAARSLYAEILEALKRFNEGELPDSDGEIVEEKTEE